MSKSIVCILLCLGTVRGNIRQVLLPGGGPASSYYGQAHCDVICDEESYATTSVCATDGKLYKTQCEYQNAQCKAAKSGDVLGITSYGACVTLDSTCDVALQTRCFPHRILMNTGSGDGFEPICGSNNVTYGSVCEFRTAQCHNEQMPTLYEPLTLLHTGECQLDTANLLMVNCSHYTMSNSGLAIEGGAHVYPHGTACPKNYHPICTLDGRTYSNECMYCNFLIATHSLPKNSFVTYARHDGRCTSAEIFG
ncbi:ovoinhibitor-like [Mercenaria mercenaria]|uniref:ovoinhibitor-like n=1 Tax=Mercenaria mercenaria TaxID=6596 RepID=UPI00234EBBBB|nr:ovoinhibitor-like [Mercenaria mercenaria]